MLLAGAFIPACSVYTRALLDSAQEPDSTSGDGDAAVASGGAPVIQPGGGAASHDGDAGGADGSGSGSGNGGSDATTGGYGGSTPGEPCEEYPMTSRSLWVATASSSAYDPPLDDSPDRAIDMNESTRWATGKAMTPSDWFQVDFSRGVALSRVTVLHDTGDFARSYEVVVSDTEPDALSNAQLAGTNEAESLIISFATPLVGRYLLLRQTGTSGSWWSIKDLTFECE